MFVDTTYETKLKRRIPGDVWLSVEPPAGSHFRLREFANADGIAIVHPALLYALERLREALGEALGEEILIRITSGTRTQADQVRLAARLGWTDEGGLVARDSKHLPRYGGIAADLYAVSRSGHPVPQKVLAEHARRFFDYVKGDYADGHVHCDMRAASRWA